MSGIRGNCKLSLSREALRRFFNDELMGYSTLSELECGTVDKGPSDDQFLILHLIPKSKSNGKEGTNA